MISTALIFAGVFLIITWFGVRKKMMSEGKWESEGGSGAYLWLAIYVGLIIVGFII